ncbi:hypothetical protein HFO61_30205 [Rhizobium leguminosarum]|uniref:hypothetical protein n=1 Tax=Rhizobium leguminosarum TaxID=384 RepID=UPI001C960B5E|nr:hypothetical protein [Rhizobium leguminosarum]MBY5551020.1 hypothetical protein [Rhizobium leguminosarum]
MHQLTRYWPGLVFFAGLVLGTTVMVSVYSEPPPVSLGPPAAEFTPRDPQALDDVIREFAAARVKEIGNYSDPRTSAKRELEFINEANNLAQHLPIGLAILDARPTMTLNQEYPVRLRAGMKATVAQKANGILPEALAVEFAARLSSLMRARLEGAGFKIVAPASVDREIKDGLVSWHFTVTPTQPDKQVLFATLIAVAPGMKRDLTFEAPPLEVMVMAAEKSLDDRITALLKNLAIAAGAVTSAVLAVAGVVGLFSPTARQWIGNQKGGKSKDDGDKAA